MASPKERTGRPVIALDATGPTRRDGEESKHTTGPLMPETLPIPRSHLDLLIRPICGVFTTLGHDGQPQSTLVWVDLDRGCALVNTTLERRKGATCLTTRRSACSSSTPGNTSRYIQIRGDAELITRGAASISTR
jgi:Pyridoxamine 5'-phosphate oxidase